MDTVILPGSVVSLYVVSTTRGSTMLNKIVLALFAVVFLTATKPASADSIVTLASLGTSADAGQTNSNGATIAISQNPHWANALPGSSWVSYTSTGNPNASGFVTVPNGTIVTFSDTFNLAGPATSGTLDVMADDSATVLLNGVSLIGETLTNNPYNICSNFGVGCQKPTVLDLPTSLLQTGANTLQFEVAQRDGSSFGLDYVSSITDPVSTPESASGILLALGLAALTFAGLMRKPA